MENPQEENKSTFNKSIKEARLDFFDEIKKDLLSNDCIIAAFDGIKIVIDTQSSKFGIVDFYPNANKVLVRKDNHWETAGIKWIKDNLVK